MLGTKKFSKIEKPKWAVSLEQDRRASMASPFVCTINQSPSIICGINSRVLYYAEGGEAKKKALDPQKGRKPREPHTWKQLAAPVSKVTLKLLSTWWLCLPVYLPVYLRPFIDKEQRRK
jgi:hypothetical protein